jgi:hypothetical protein
MTDILAGYQIHFNTWENDADARLTTIWSGIQNSDDVKFLLALAGAFVSKNSEVQGLGNGGTTPDQLIDLIENLIEKYHPSWDLTQLFMQEREEVDDDDDLDGELLADRWYDLLCGRILGQPVEEMYRYEYTRFCRVFDDAEVFYFPDNVENVTNQFV